MKILLFCSILCLFACTHSDKNDSKTLQLQGKIFEFSAGVTEFNPQLCSYSDGTDCNIGDFIFEDATHCYLSNFCCCGIPEEYYKGKYRISGSEVICEFESRYVLEYDAPKTKLNKEGVAPINPIPVYAQDKAFTYRFKMGYCAEGRLYLYDYNSDKTYLRLKNTVFTEGVKFNRVVDKLLDDLN